MTQMTKYVGLDVHQATTVAAVREENGRMIARSVLPTDAAALLEFVRGMRGAIHVTFEEGTQAQWLYNLLVPVVDRVVVCNRRGQTQQGNKGDHADAAELADLLRRGAVRAVYHDGGARAALKELARTYQNLVEDGTRVMLRLKALFRARGIRTPGQAVYRGDQRGQWLAQLTGTGVRFRAEVLYAELAVLQQLRPKVKAALRFRTKRHLWAYAGLAVVTRTSAEYEHDGRRPMRKKRAPMTRGLNRNHNRVLKDVLKGAATAAATRAGPLQDFYRAMIARGMREELARVTLARKLAALTLRLWKTGERYDPTQLTVQAG